MIWELIKKIARSITAWIRFVECEKCKSHDIELKTFAVVDPTKLGKDVYVAAGYSMAAQCGLKNAEGNYKYPGSGDIMQARDEIYFCHNCGHKSEIRRERVIACEL